MQVEAEVFDSRQLADGIVIELSCAVLGGSLDGAVAGLSAATTVIACSPLVARL
jgi:hypothetical protein